MKKYLLVDYYDTPEKVGCVDSKEEAKLLTKERFLDTDGECEVWALTLNEATGKYSRSNKWLVQF